MVLKHWATKFCFDKTHLEKCLLEQIVIEIVTNSFTTLYIFLNFVSLPESANHYPIFILLFNILLYTTGSKNPLLSSWGGICPPSLSHRHAYDKWQISYII